MAEDRRCNGRPPAGDDDHARRGFGRGIFEAFPDNPNEPHASGVHNLSASLERVLDKNSPDVMAVQTYDKIRFLACREQAYRWHLIQTVAVKAETGKIIRWFGTTSTGRSGPKSRPDFWLRPAPPWRVDCGITLQKVANRAVRYFVVWSAVDMANDGSLRWLAAAASHLQGQ